MGIRVNAMMRDTLAGPSEGQVWASTLLPHVLAMCAFMPVLGLPGH